ncbi:kinase [Planotetraspora kaengkrachanensis]|uniref:kinase n=1 Tax=Planotetraspora kaengkrachanensis TaxID=575193 RepID=UPI0019409CA0|nr:kinase [Planotetraspora kaengkrachanensis]
MCTGSHDTRLIVLRGNSGSGKTSVARAVRVAYGRGLALVGQDVVRRDLLRERDVHGGVNIGLIDTIARYSLDHGYHVLLEGILTASRYGAMLESLRHDHAGISAFFYLDVSFAETLRRHDSRPQRSEFTPDQMREWYQERDLLPDGSETVIGEGQSSGGVGAAVAAPGAPDSSAGQPVTTSPSRRRPPLSAVITSIAVGQRAQHLAPGGYIRCGRRLTTCLDK